MIKKYICVLKWSRFFSVFILLCIINGMLATTNRCIVGGIGTYNLKYFLYVVVCLNSLLWYDRFYRSDTGLQVLKTTPVKIEKIVKMYKYSKYFAVLFSSVIGVVFHFFYLNIFGIFVIPKAVILLLINGYVNKLVERNELKEDNELGVTFILGGGVTIAMYLIEDLALDILIYLF